MSAKHKSITIEASGEETTALGRVLDAFGEGMDPDDRVSIEYLYRVITKELERRDKTDEEQKQRGEVWAQSLMT